VLSFYLVVQDQGIDDFLRIVTPVKRHEYILNLWRRAQHKIGRWLQGQLLLSVLIGAMIYVGLLLLHVRHAALLALVAAILELIPVFGSIMAAVPAVAISFIDGGASFALVVIALYVGVNQLEGNVIYPLVVQKVLGVSPLVVILAIIAGAQIGGFLGILIAVPIAASIQEYVNDVQKGKRSHEGLVSSG
jgi:predicted PurR-regulated permease PerM